MMPLHQDEEAAQLRAQLDAANADRARLRAALEEVRDCKAYLPVVVGAALSSTDASHWLAERERRVAEKVSDRLLTLFVRQILDCGVCDDIELRRVAESVGHYNIDALLKEET